MSPEERAAQIVRQNHAYSDKRQFSDRERRERDRIAAAIREAIQEEREACAEICVQENHKWISWPINSHEDGIKSGAAMNASGNIYRAIQQRSEMATNTVLTDDKERQVKQ